MRRSLTKPPGGPWQWLLPLIASQLLQQQPQGSLHFFNRGISGNRD
ncbi:MAG: hypothetical protein R2932_35065 [Caldilineaceae bacterium]